MRTQPSYSNRSPKPAKARMVAGAASLLLLAACSASEKPSPEKVPDCTITDESLHAGQKKLSKSAEQHVMHAAKIYREGMRVEGRQPGNSRRHKGIYNGGISTPIPNTDKTVYLRVRSRTTFPTKPEDIYSINTEVQKDAGKNTIVYTAQGFSNDAKEGWTGWTEYLTDYKRPDTEREFTKSYRFEVLGEYVCGYTLSRNEQPKQGLSESGSAHTFWKPSEEDKRGFDDSKVLYNTIADQIDRLAGATQNTDALSNAYEMPLTSDVFEKKMGPIPVAPVPVLPR